MAYIKAVTVTGLAGADVEHRLLLDRYVNVLFGANGAGKTSLLRILSAALGGKALPLRHVAFRSVTLTLHWEDENRDVTLTLSKADFQRAESESPYYDPNSDEVVSPAEQVAWSILPPIPPKRPKFNHIFLPISRLFGEPQQQEPSQSWLSPRRHREGTSEESLNKQFSAGLTEIWKTYFAKVLAEVSAAQAEGLTNILRAVLSIGPQEDFTDALASENAYDRVASFLARQGHRELLGSREEFDDRLRKSNQLRSVVFDLEKVERRIELAYQPKASLESLLERLFRGGKRVRFSDNLIEVALGENQRLELGQLSSGEKQLLRLLVDTLRAGRNPLIVDEPELSMHVDWQQELIRNMRQLNGKAQIIVATHSPEIMAEVDDHCIIRI